MKTRKELEEMGLDPLLVRLLQPEHIKGASHEDLWAVWAGDSDGAIFAHGHEPVSKEGRELLRVAGAMVETHESMYALADKHITRRDGHRLSTAIFAYRDSLKPVDVVPDGWEPVGMKFSHENGTIWNGEPRAISVNHNGFTMTCQRDTLPEAFAAAESMMERLGLLAPKPDADGWHKTDGRAPPKEAGERVIRTVDADGSGIWHDAPATARMHGWGSEDKNTRPIKWCYADGGSE
jgi:hypothetical protein